LSDIENLDEKGRDNCWIWMNIVGLNGMDRLRVRILRVILIIIFIFDSILII